MYYHNWPKQRECGGNHKENYYVDITENISSDKSKLSIIKGNWLKSIISLEDVLNRNFRKIKTKGTESTYNR